MTFRTNAAPYQRNKKTTLQIMLELCLALLLIWIVAVIYQFIKVDAKHGVKAILMLVVALMTTALCDVITTLFKHPQKNKLAYQIKNDLIHNYSYVTAIIFTLTLPVWTSYYVVIIGSIFATIVVKNCFGGFGKNIFNPAIMARIFVGFCFKFVANDILHPSVDAITGATLTTTIKNSTNWVSDIALENFSMKDLFLGNYLGALGETFTILILCLGVILAIRKIINWRTPVFYLGTVVITTLIIALVLEFKNPIQYVGYHLALGGLAFGAVFMLSDPVTSPTSPFGKSLIGVLAGFLTILIRVKGGYPEGVMYSIAICNILSCAIDALTVGKTNTHLLIKYGIVFGSIIACIGITTGVSYYVNGGKEIYEINGIETTEYQQMVDILALKEKHQLSAKVDDLRNEDYYIVDENHHQVAIVYHIQDVDISFDTQYAPVQFMLDVYIAISFENDTLYAVGIVKGGSTSSYEKQVKTWADQHFVEKNLSQIQTTQIVQVGATYSANGLKKAIEKSYEQYALEKGEIKNE